MKPTTPIISGGMNALRLPGFFANLGHGNVINTSGGGSYGHIDSPAAGAISLRQAYECWKAAPTRSSGPGSTRNLPVLSSPSRATPTRSIRAGARSSASIARSGGQASGSRAQQGVRWPGTARREHAP
jgi:ribulose 1,5-bisphosphate carboxylase large subunit-like protein